MYTLLRKLICISLNCVIFKRLVTKFMCSVTFLFFSVTSERSVMFAFFKCLRIYFIFKTYMDMIIYMMQILNILLISIRSAKLDKEFLVKL